MAVRLEVVSQLQISAPVRRCRLQRLLNRRSYSAWLGTMAMNATVFSLVGRSADGSLLLVCSDVGFGPQFPWGGLDRAADSLGMDSQWHSGLEHVAICCGLLDAPPGYAVPGPRLD